MVERDSLGLHVTACVAYIQIRRVPQDAGDDTPQGGSHHETCDYPVLPQGLISIYTVGQFCSHWLLTAAASPLSPLTGRFAHSASDPRDLWHKVRRGAGGPSLGGVLPAGAWAPEGPRGVGLEGDHGPGD